MADEKFPTVLVQWEGNNSKRYDDTKEEILLSNVVAVQRCCYQQDGCHWTCLWSVKCWKSHRVQFVGKKGKVQLWCGVVVSTDPDAECRAGSASNELETKSKRTRCHHTSTTTKEASCLNTTDSDMAERRTAATSLFENSSSTKGKRQKCPSNSPLPGPEPKQKHGEWAT